MNNSQRSLQGVVSVDGWIAKFDKNDSATVHVDIVFRQGHFGEDSQKKIRFRICLTRAEIVLRIADGEPLRIIKQSIARTPLPDMATRETVKTTNRRAARKVKALASLNKRRQSRWEQTCRGPDRSTLRKRHRKVSTVILRSIFRLRTVILAELGKAESGTERLIASIALFEEAFKVLSTRRSQVDWALALVNQGDALLALARRTADLSHAERALQQLNRAWAYLQKDNRDGDFTYCLPLIEVAQDLVDRLTV